MKTADTTVTTTVTRRPGWDATDLGLIAVFAAIVAGAALVPGLPLAMGVPITFQTLAVMLTGMMLGPGRAFAAVGLYTLLGLAGLPVFSGGRSGLGVLAGPSAGYIIGFTVAATLVGFLTVQILRRTRRYRGVWLFAAAMVSSILTIHTLGVAGIVVNTGATVQQAFLADLAFYPGDVVKNILAAIIAVSLHRAFPDVLVRRAARR